MKKTLCILASSLLTMTAFNAFAQELKIGIVNVDQVLLKSQLAISFNEKLSKDFKPRQEEVNSAQQKLQNDLDQFSYNSYKMSPDERNKLQNVINSDRSTFNVLSASLQKDLATVQNQYSTTLQNKLNDVIAKIAQSDHYDIIQSQANILYLNNAFDITPKVIDQLK